MEEAHSSILYLILIHLILSFRTSIVYISEKYPYHMRIFSLYFKTLSQLHVVNGDVYLLFIIYTIIKDVFKRVKFLIYAICYDMSIFVTQNFLL